MKRWALVAQGPGEGVLEQLDLVVAADERGVGRALDRRSVGRERGPRPHRLLAAPDLDRADVVDFDVSEREAVHGRADQDLARLRDLLQAGGQVDGLAGGEGRVAGARHDLAGLDADPRLELEVVDRLEDPECGPDGALGVVLVRLRDAEGGHDGVAGELLDLPPCVSMQRETWSKNWVTRRRTTSGSLAATSDVESTRSTNRTVASLRSIGLLVRTYRRAFSIPLVLDPKVFKAYDVRGIYPTELDEDGGYAIGRAYVEQFEPKGIAVGRDMRLSSPSMAKAAIEGAADGGADVIDIGLVGTEMVYFAVGHLDLDGGIQVTASHNPKEYTGMKIVRRGALPVGGDSGLLDIRDRALALTNRSEGSTSDRSVRKTSFRAACVQSRPVLHRTRRGRAAPRRDRRGETGLARRRCRRCSNGSHDAVPISSGARRELPEPLAEPAAAGEPRVGDAVLARSVDSGPRFDGDADRRFPWTIRWLGAVGRRYGTALPSSFSW